MQQSAPVSFVTVSIEGDFWRERLETVLTRTIPGQHGQMEAAGMIEALAVTKPAPPPRIPADDKNFTPQMLWDAEVGKWLEAASYSLAFRRQPAIAGQINAIAELLAKAQLPDGYLNSWFIAREPEKRWTNLRDNHELYCAGHLIEAAVAHFQATGERTLIDVVLKYVDHIAATFGPGEEQRHGYCGHPEIELAPVRLHGVTKEEKHLNLASYFIDARGQPPHLFDIEAVARGDETQDFVGRTYEFNQSHRPVRSQDKAVGHTVGAMTLYAAMACLAGEWGDGSLRRAVDALWADVTQHHLYVTGGIGPDRKTRSFGESYRLPNEADAETSAAVGLVLWAKHMLTLKLDGKYADAMELALYNGALAGISHDGLHYFHHNPLVDDGTRRWEWDRDPGSATEIARLITSVGGLFYSTTEDGIAVHHYGGASATLSAGGRAVSLKETSGYPWSGKISIAVEPERPDEFTLRLRIPGFARDAGVRINGAGIDVAGNLINGYLEIRRSWNPGDKVDLDLPMPVERLRAHPAIKADAGRVALRRGPLIYCFEEEDNPGAPLDRMRLPRDASLTASERGDLFGGIIAIVAKGVVAAGDDWGSELYRTTPPQRKPATWTAVPYYLWANRNPGAMLVWARED